MTVYEELTKSEREHLDVLPWYVFLKAQPEAQIRLFFQRLRERIQTRTSNADLGELQKISQQLEGLTFVEGKFLQIKKEKTLDK